MDSASEHHPLNLNSPHFDSEAFVNNLIQKKGLDELVAVEEDMVQNVRRLDSEMQQLVYENYNKFLTATTTVRNMQTAFADMDNEMQGLSDRMKNIFNLSESLSQMFNNNREAVRKLTDNSKTVQRLQYFVKLPQILQNLIEHKNLKRAVEIYVNVRPKLEKYKDTKSLSGIYVDCKMLMDALETQLRDSLDSKIFSTEDILEAGRLLKLFGIPESEIRSKLLANWHQQLSDNLQALESQSSFKKKQIDGDNCEPSSKNSCADILEFVDNGCCTFLTNLSLYISLFVQLFKKSEDRVDLMEMVDKFMNHLKKILLDRFCSERDSRDCALFVKALDRISRKISVFSRVLPGMDFSRMNAEIVTDAAEHQIKICRENIKTSTHDHLYEIFENFASVSSPTTKNAAEMEKLLKNLEDFKLTNDNEPNQNIEKGTGNINQKLPSIVSKLEQSFLVSVKTCLANLLLFTANDMNFNNIDPVYFGAGSTFSVNVFNNIVAGSLNDLGDLAMNSRQLFAEFISGDEINLTFFLIFCSFLHNLKSKHVAYLIDLSQEQFKLVESKERKQKILPTKNLDELTKKLKLCMESLLRNFVETKCSSLDAIVVKSIESFNWMECSDSPRSVRPLVKHLLHRIESIDARICALTAEKNNDNQKKDSFKGSSTTSSTMRRAASAASSTLTNTYETASLGGSSLGGGGGGAMGIMEKLWSDEPEEQSINFTIDKSAGGGTLAQIFASMAWPLEFRHESIIGAIIRVCLLRMAECVALNSFSEFGLQQLQIDCAYLKHHLWELASDEHSLNTLIEECITVAVSQCAQPKLLDPTVVRTICEES